MDKKDTETKKRFIQAWFEKFEGKITNINELIKLSFLEEAMILVCCYIETLAQYRYQPSFDKNRQAFIDIICNYSDKRKKKLFSKISIIYFCERQEPTKKEKIKKYDKIKAFLKRKFKKLPIHPSREMDKEKLIALLKKNIHKLDLQNLRSNLDSFSYAAILYKEYRCCGVHNIHIRIPRNLQTGRLLFEKNENGEDVYYSTFRKLLFSKEIILSILKTIHKNLKNECIKKGGWPHEL